MRGEKLNLVLTGLSNKLGSLGVFSNESFLGYLSFETSLVYFRTKLIEEKKVMTRSAESHRFADFVISKNL